MCKGITKFVFHIKNKYKSSGILWFSLQNLCVKRPKTNFKLKIYFHSILNSKIYKFHLFLFVFTKFSILAHKIEQKKYLCVFRFVQSLEMSSLFLCVFDIAFFFTTFFYVQKTYSQKNPILFFKFFEFFFKIEWFLF